MVTTKKNIIIIYFLLLNSASVFAKVNSENDDIEMAFVISSSVGYLLHSDVDIPLNKVFCIEGGLYFLPFSISTQFFVGNFELPRDIELENYTILANSKFLINNVSILIGYVSGIEGIGYVQCYLGPAVIGMNPYFQMNEEKVDLKQTEKVALQFGVSCDIKLPGLNNRYSGIAFKPDLGMIVSHLKMKENNFYNPKYYLNIGFGIIYCRSYYEN